MSILSDKEIKELCTKPTHVIYTGPEDKPTTKRFIKATAPEIIADMENFNKYNTTSEMVASSSNKKLDLSRWSRYRPYKDEDGWLPLITPFNESSIKELKGMPIPSFGLGSYSYDIRINRNFKVFKKPDQFQTLPIIDTGNKNPTQGLMQDIYDVDYIDIEPGGFVLGSAIEEINMPRDLTGICMAKSSLARIALDAKVTPVESGWNGVLTIEMSNFSPYPIRVWAGIGIMAIVFVKGNIPCTTAYNERVNGGKYQNQPSVPVETMN